MTPNTLTALVAERVMHWSVAPDRFLLGNRQWIARSRFQPLNHVQDAFRLLHKAASTFSLTRTVDGVFTATVRIAECTGTATGKSEASTITYAVARAIGLELDDHQPPKTGAEGR